VAEEIATTAQVSTNLPEEVRHELFSVQTNRLYRAVGAKHDVDSAKIGELGSLTFQLLQHRFPASEYIAQIAKALEVTEEQARAIALDVVVDVLIRFDKDLPHIDFKQLVRGWNTQMDGVALQTADEFTHAYVASIPGDVTERQKQRLEVVLDDVAEHKVEHDAAKARLMRSEKVGGLGLDAGLAGAVLDRFEKEIGEKVFEEKVELAEELDLKKKKVVQPSVPHKPRIDAFTDEDAKEIERVKAEKAAALAHEPIKSVEDVVKLICSGKMFSFENPVLIERCQKIIDSRVRGVRDARAMRSQMERAVAKGGMGISGRQLAEMVQAVEAAVREYEAHGEGMMMKGRAAHKQMRAAKLEHRAGREQREQTDLDARFEKMTGKKVVADASVPGAIESSDQDLTVDVGAIRSAAKGAQAAKPRVKKSIKKPGRIQDIKVGKRLVGPTQELARLTITDFRRLSKDPMQAGTKIQDKIDLLENRGYEMKVKGIQAWRESPLNRMYITLTERAVLGGVTIQEALEESQQAEGESLTDEELQVVMKLNAALRF